MIDSAREAVLGRVRSALGKKGRDPQGSARAEAVIAAHREGPRPALPVDLVARFIDRARDMSSTVDRIEDVRQVPSAVAHYVHALVLPPELAQQKSLHGVCWPELAHLDWSGAGLHMQARPTLGDDRLGVTGVFCAIAETGTLVFLAGAETPTATVLLPDTHVAVLHASRVVGAMEDAFALIRQEKGQLPRAVNLVSGPSRTGDIEQTIVLGAHGPYRVHILVVG